MFNALLLLPVVFTQVFAVGHTVNPEGKVAHVRSQFVLNGPTDIDLGEATHVSAPEATLTTENGHVVVHHDRTVFITWDAPLKGNVIALPDLKAPTRVTLLSGWSAAPEGALEQHVGYVAEEGMDRKEIRTLNHWLGDTPHGAQRVFLNGGAVLKLREPGFLHARGMAGAGVAAFLGLLGLWRWQKKLHRAAELARAEAIIAGDFTALDS